MSEKAFTDEQAQELMRRNMAGASMAELAREAGVPRQAVRRAMLRNGYIPRPRGRPPLEHTPEFLAEISRAYESGDSQQTIGNRVGLSQTAIGKLLKANGVQTRARNWAGAPLAHVGENHPNWRGGRIRYGNYVSVYVLRDDPLAVMQNRDGYVPEHRLVMARSLGRPLRPDETVHHINGEPTDNRLENLQLRTGLHGKHVALVCADCGSSNVVPRSLME